MIAVDIPFIRLRDMRILFVDDDEFVRKALRRVLVGSRRSWHVEFAESGDQALQLLSQNQYDMVVSDMRMPGMSGEKLLAQVAALYPETIRVVLSGQSEYECQGAIEHAQHYLAKPCVVDDLEAVVLQHVQS